MSNCSDHALGEQLLSSSSDEARENSQLVDHLDNCASCHAALEQRQRLRAHWDARALTTFEIARLRVGLSNARLQPHSRSRAALVGGLALVAFASLAVAGSLVMREAQRASPPPSSGSQPPKAPAALDGLAQPEPTPLPNQLPSSAPLASASVAAKTAPVPASRSSAPEARPDPRWTTVTQAMRSHDAAAAEKALRALGTSNDPRTRDSARLTLAEMWLSSGRQSEARPLLKELARSGATPVVRSRAALLLQ